MTVNAQELITAATFNGLQSRIETVLGQGFSDTGYGQTVSSSIVAANTVITATHLSNLKSDIDKCRAHQTGSLTSLSTINATDRIGASESIDKDGTTDTSKGVNDYLAIIGSILSSPIVATKTPIILGVSGFMVVMGIFECARYNLLASIQFLP